MLNASLTIIATIKEYVSDEVTRYEIYKSLISIIPNAETGIDEIYDNLIKDMQCEHTKHD